MEKVVQIIRRPVAWSILCFGLFCSYTLVKPIIYSGCVNIHHITVAKVLIANDTEIAVGCGRMNDYFTAQRLLHEGNFSDAILTFHHVNARYRQLASWFLIQAYDGNGDYEAALKQSDLNTEQGRKKYISLLVKYESILSEREFQTYFDQVKAHPDALLIYIQYLLSEKRYIEAGEYAKQIQTIDYVNAAQVALGRAYLYQNKTEDAIAVFKDLYPKTTSSEVLFWYGKALFAHGEQQHGLQLMLKAVNHDHSELPTRFITETAYTFALIGECSTAKTLLIKGQTMAKQSDAKEIDITQAAFTEICTAN